MKAEEFRIGNYHLYHIEDPMDEREEWDEVCQIDHDDLRIFTEYGDNEEYKPIPLNEEWLGKIEHTKLNGTIIIDRFRLKWLPNYKYWYVTDFQTNCYLTKIEFAHELQNFYYVMQGNELQLKTL